MVINCTNQAIAEINRKMGANIAKIKLVYNVEGCGCALSGVPELWAVDQVSEFDQLIKAGSFPIYYDKRHTVFFEDELFIDYSPEKRVFILKSKQQIYNAHMQLHDKRVQYTETV